MKVRYAEGDIIFEISNDRWTFSIDGEQRWYHYVKDHEDDWYHPQDMPWGSAIWHGTVFNGKCVKCRKKLPEEVRIQGELQKISRPRF